MTEYEKISSDSCLKASIGVLVTVTVFISLLMNIETREKFKFYAHYIQLRLNLKLSIDKFEMQPCWDHIIKNRTGNDNPIYWNIDKLEEKCKIINKKLMDSNSDVHNKTETVEIYDHQQWDGKIVVKDGIMYKVISPERLEPITQVQNTPEPANLSTGQQKKLEVNKESSLAKEDISRHSESNTSASFPFQGRIESITLYPDLILLDEALGYLLELDKNMEECYFNIKSNSYRISVYKWWLLRSSSNYFDIGEDGYSVLKGDKTSYDKNGKKEHNLDDDIAKLKKSLSYFTLKKLSDYEYPSISEIENFRDRDKMYVPYLGINFATSKATVAIQSLLIVLMLYINVNIMRAKSSDAFPSKETIFGLINLNWYSKIFFLLLFCSPSMSQISYLTVDHHPSTLEYILGAFILYLNFHIIILTFQIKQKRRIFNRL